MQQAIKISLFLLLVISPLSWAINPHSNPQIEKAKAYLNKMQYQKARSLLEQEAAKNNPYATYWLANLQFLTREKFIAGSTYQKAAQLGSPWAMRRLVGGKGSLCKYLGWPCNKDWFEQIAPAFKKLADQGDGDALIAYYNYKKPNYKPSKLGEKVTFDDKVNAYHDIAVRSVEGGSYEPLKHEIYWDNHSQERINYLKQFAEKGYAPAMIQLARYYDKKNQREKGDQLIDKAILAGYAPPANGIRLAYKLGKYGKKKDMKKAYFYNQLARKLTQSNVNSYPNMYLLTFAKDKDGKDILDEDGYYKKIWLVTPEEQEQIKKDVDQFIKDNHIEANLFLNEFSLFFKQQ